MIGKGLEVEPRRRQEFQIRLAARRVGDLCLMARGAGAEPLNHHGAAIVQPVARAAALGRCDPILGRCCEMPAEVGAVIERHHRLGEVRIGRERRMLGESAECFGMADLALRVGH